MKKSSKSKSTKPSKSAAAKSITVSKSVAIAPVADKAKTRSMAAYKAHMTRQANALKAAKKPEDKAAARAALDQVTSNMNAFSRASA
jgi:hypothetical protein